jgi:hypothetical protein
MVTGGSQYEIYGKTHYERNADDYKCRAKKRKLRIIKFLRRVKHNAGCADCSIKDPIVLDFDHIGAKTINPASIVNVGWGFDRIKKELRNCEVVCSNCHRRRTYARRSASGVSR